MKPPKQRADRRGDRGRGPDQGVGLLLSRSLEIAVDQGLHGGQQQRRPKPTHHCPEDDDGRQALGQGHRQRAERVAQPTQHIGQLAPDQIADLASNQDERGGYQGLERDRGLDAADSGVEIVNHRCDRDIHQ